MDRDFVRKTLWISAVVLAVLLGLALLLRARSQDLTRMMAARAMAAGHYARAQTLLEKTERGHKLLAPDGIPTDRAINGMQQFILRNRDAICDPTAPDRRITFHGLRHTYAAEKYTSLVDGGMTPLDAHFTVSRLLGHERLDVTDIYLASVKGDAAHGE